jgi:replicative DNA helicase
MAMKAWISGLHRFSTCIEVSAALQHSHHDLFILAARPGDNALALRRMHIARLTADKALIKFYFSLERSSGEIVLHGKA